MKLRPIKASEYLAFDPSHQKLLRKYGGVPVNDAIMPIWDDDFDFLLMYGGRGGGKSEGMCDLLLDQCMNDEYFKCYYGRKVYNSVRESCFATLIYCIKKNKLEDYFIYSEADTSSMVITCRANGNKFIPFGADKPDKLKSIKDPTHIWAEEFDQFDFEDFKQLVPTVRTIRGRNLFLCTFNAYDVVFSHWLIKLFFPEYYDGIDSDDVKAVDILEGKRVKKVFVNYFDNYFIDQEEYRKTLLIAAGGNEKIYNGLANGDWGINLSGSLWLFAFSRDKHMAKYELKADRSEILYLSFDFNRNPQACTIMQWPKQQVLKIIEVIKEPNIGTEGVCEILLKKYPGYLYVITGDYSGDTVSSIFKEHVTNYTMIKSKLLLSENQIMIMPNPPLKSNKTLCNAVFYSYPVEVCPVKARPFIFDAENVRTMADGTIEKKDRKDPAQQADVLDTVRYFINKFLSFVLRN